MIVKTEKKGNIIIYYVDKDFSDEKMSKILNTKLRRDQIKTIINHDADVYTKEGLLLLKFRKNVLSKKCADEFYENVISFAKRPTSNRGSASASKTKNVKENPKIMTNIIGYFDKFSPSQKQIISQMRLKIPISVRETLFVIDYPEKYKKIIPFVKEVDEYYRKLVPEQYDKQIKKARQTPFKIDHTAFTTITTNVNFQTAVHTDKGDDSEGFGNISVIEHGDYSGGETCFPQYGIGVDVRTCDVAFMNVHEPHGNLPIHLHNPKSDVRLSIVCYLRKSIWQQTKGKTRKFMIKHNKTIRKLRR